MIRLRWERPLALGIAVGLLGLWEWLSRSALISPLFFPAPTRVLARLWQMVQSGELGVHLGATLGRLLAGLAVGGGAGLLVGLAMGASPRLRRTLDPFVAAVHPIPKISLLPLVMLALGIGEASKVAVVALVTFFPMAINTMEGVRQLSPVHFEVARNCGARPWTVFGRILLPGSLPMILTGLRLSLNVGLVLAIAVELVAANEGLGALIWLAWQTLRTEVLYASILVASLLGIGFNLVVQGLARVGLPWRQQT